MHGRPKTKQPLGAGVGFRAQGNTPRPANGASHRAAKRQIARSLMLAAKRDRPALCNRFSPGRHFLAAHHNDKDEDDGKDACYNADFSL